MATIRCRIGKSGKKSYEVKVRRKGFALSKTFARKTIADAWARKVEQQIDDGVFQNKAKSENPKRTLGDLIDLYICDYLPQLSASNQKDNKGQLLWWKEKIGTVLLE